MVFGGGRRMFSPSWVPDLETGQPGLRGDIDLIAEWRADKVNHLDNSLPWSHPLYDFDPFRC